MKKISIIFCTLIFSVFANGQNPAQINWQTLVSFNEFFTVETPIKLEFQEYGKEKTNRRYSNQINNTYFFVFVDEIKKGKSEEIWQYKGVLSFIANFQMNGEKGKMSIYDAERFELVDSEDFHHKVIIIKTTKYLYAFQTISQNPNDEIAERFFQSIKIEGNSSKFSNFTNSEINDKSVNEEVKKPISDGITVNLPPPPKVIDNKKETGKVETNTIAAPTQTKALNLTSKPKANYTDYARFYEIQGSVLLRVTFFANGKIGTVTPVSKLPFGLTNTAIAAAKQIRFEPMIRNDVPQTVVKQVQYNFTLY